MTTSTRPARCASRSSAVIAARVAALAEVGRCGHRLDQVAAVGRAVGVEVVQHDEPAPGRLGPGEHARCSGGNSSAQRS